MAFTKEALRKRQERFTAFVQQNPEGYICQPVFSTGKRRHPYIVASSTELALIVFTWTGGVEVTVPPGRLKELILPWVKEEGCPYHENSAPGELAKLDPYNYLLKRDTTNNLNAYNLNAFPLSDAHQLKPQLHPLVELAELLGHVVYDLSPSEPASPRYGIATQQEMVAQGSDLVQLFAQLIAGRPAESQGKSTQPYFPGRIYLSTHVRHSLAYWRKETPVDGGWMTQRMLAELAGLDEHTVSRIEQVRQADHSTYVYLSTAKAIIAALNEVRERERLPLLQLWNIDWTPEQRDDEYA